MQMSVLIIVQLSGNNDGDVDMMCWGRDGWMAPGCGTCSVDSVAPVKQPAAPQPDLVTKNSPHVCRDTISNLGQIQFTIWKNTIYNSNYNTVQQPVVLLTDLEYQKAHHMLPASLRSPRAPAIFYLSESLVKTVVLAGAGHEISSTLAAFQLNMSPCVSRGCG